MTSRTGATAQTLKGTRDPPPFPLALFGASLQISVTLYIWVTSTSAAACLSDPAYCLFNLCAADVWGRQALLTLVFAFFLWCASGVHPTHDGYSDPSLVDRLWSIQPMVCAWHFLLSSINSGTWSPRLVLMTTLVTLWGLRLTWNFWLKGGFSGGEDYRWKEVRTWFPGWKFEVFNFIFICTFQQMLILAFTTPIVPAAQNPQVPLGRLDLAATVLFILLFLGETTADLQMYFFQTEKYRRLKQGEPLGEMEAGFIRHGLWALSRHPNYFCEVSLWWAFYLFAVSATGYWLNWTIVGATFLTLLFVPPGASLDVTETLSSRKYAAYANYQNQVSRFIPWLSAKPRAD